MADITSANAVFLISVPLLLPVPQQLQGFAVDDIFDIDDVDSTDTMMGVDGILSGGMVFQPKPMNIALQADSASLAFFDAWYQGQQTAMVAYAAQATITFTGLQRTYALLTGYLSRYKPMADAKRVLQPRKFRVTWQSITPAPIGAAG
jgi:hypothetical protein